MTHRALIVLGLLLCLTAIARAAERVIPSGTRIDLTCRGGDTATITADRDHLLIHVETGRACVEAKRNAARAEKGWTECVVNNRIATEPESRWWYGVKVAGITAAAIAIFFGGV